MSADLADGEEREVQGSGSARYRIKHQAGVYSCTCPAWMHQSISIERRTCKHIRRIRGEEAEELRVGATTGATTPSRAAATSGSEEAKAPPLLLAHRWDSVLDLTGWWMSEKLDGIRAYWDGSSFWSRLGNRFHPPDWFVAGMPETPLDGELWGGRKKFQRTTGIVRQRGADEAWKEIEYVVFDAPAHGGTFEERIELCAQLVAGAAIVHMRALANVPCEGIAHLQAELARVEAMGGEGLMLRRPGSRYEAGRSSSLLKVKTFHDAEARVVDHVKGAGRHKGRLGALQVELANGTRFSVGTGFSDREREHPPRIGALITFRYQELSDAGVPRFPSYVGERIDASWPETTEETSNMRRYEFSEGSSNKFWEIEIDGDEVTTRWGKIGTDGQSKTKEFGSPAAAKREYDKLVEDKTGKGYEEVGKAKTAKAAPPAKKAVPTPAPAKKAAPANSNKNGNAERRFEFVEGSSSKFWCVSMNGDEVTTRWGKIGTDGQSKTKEFGSPDAAKREYDKLVEDKTGKGYEEVGA